MAPVLLSRHAADPKAHTRDIEIMRRFDRPGFTFIELLIVMVVIGVLASIGVPRIRNMKERSYQATLRSDLGALRIAEEAYYAENQQYTTDVTALDFKRSTNVTITIEAADLMKGWRATARHAWLSTPCTTASGADAIGVEAGAIVCSNVSLAASGAQGGD
jgi:prepilin-type N-terminal cleavage/methylation domain-containing protein